jgi:hypothetical protein
MYSRSPLRLPGQEHVPNYPRGWIGIRVAQLLIAVVIAALNIDGELPGPSIGTWQSLLTHVVS